MRRPRRPRTLSGEEARLWAEIAKLITPLRGRARPPAPDADAAQPSATLAPGLTAKAALKPAAKAGAKVGPAKPVRAPKKAPPLPARTATAAPYQAPPQLPRPAAGIDRPERMALRRGTLPIEARIDLHGMYQTEAHAALTGFILRARAAGHAHVLVVTGKGGPDFHEAFAERGVLRRSVPHWLRGPELRGIVLGFEEAARHHGGSGALYVRLRRR